ncbi:MAG: Mur ligase domain-containing protein [Oscillospiraceae bacterium]
MNNLKLNQIINAVGGKCESSEQIEINDVCIDTRKLKKGCLYIAIKGENFDGHDFITQAIKLGAAVVISEKAVLKAGKTPIVIVKNTKQALLDLAGYYKSLFNLFTVGVTGSVGKTSTKEMVYAVLQGNNKTIKTQGNFNNEIGLPLSMFNINSDDKNAVRLWRNCCINKCC